MTTLFVAPDAYHNPTIWRRDSDDDRLPQPILARTAANARGFDALAALVEADARTINVSPVEWARELAEAFDKGVTSEREGHGYDGNPYGSAA